MVNSWIEFGRRLADARTAAGYTQGELAARLGVDRTAVSKIENGDRKVDSLELARFAELLAQPIQWFVLGESGALVSRRQARDGVRRRADLVLESLAADVEQLLEMGLLARTDLQPLGFTVDSVETAELAAKEIRRRLEIPAAPLDDLQTVAEHLGLHAFVLPLESGVEGSYVALKGAGVALIQGKDPAAKRRFTLAHELGHHIFEDEYSDEWVTGSLDERERLISAFAIHLLVPRPGVVSLWAQFNGAEDPRGAAIEIAGRYGVSWTALCAQLANLEVVTQAQRTALVEFRPSMSDFVERKIKLLPLPESPSVPPAFAAGAVRGCRRQLIGVRRAAEMLRDTLAESELPGSEPSPLASLGGEAYAF